jgi:hypothetical protein
MLRTRAYRMKFKEWRFGKNHRSEIAGSKDIAWNTVESLGQYESSSEIDGLVYSKPPKDSSTVGCPEECPQPIENVDKGKGADLEGHPTDVVSEDLLEDLLVTELPLLYSSKSANETGAYASNYASIRISAAHVQIQELLPLIEGPGADDVAFEILISKWQPGGDYMRAITKLLCDTSTKCRAAIMRYTATGGNLFKMIHDSLPSSEQVPLIKAMLESQFHPLTADEWYRYTGPAWAQAWYAACRIGTWKEVKKALMEKSMLINLIAGPLFLDCALAVIADRQFTEFMVKMTSLTSLSKPFSTQMIPEVNRFREQILVALDFFQRKGRETSVGCPVMQHRCMDEWGDRYAWATERARGYQ